MASLKDVRAAARALGAAVTHEKHGDSWRLGVEAPHGFVWSDGVHEMVDWVYAPWRPDYADMLARMAHGMETCGDPECEWCHSDHGEDE